MLRKVFPQLLFVAPLLLTDLNLMSFELDGSSEESSDSEDYDPGEQLHGGATLASLMRLAALMLHMTKHGRAFSSSSSSSSDDDDEMSSSSSSSRGTESSSSSSNSRSWSSPFWSNNSSSSSSGSSSSGNNSRWSGRLWSSSSSNDSSSSSSSSKRNGRSWGSSLWGSRTSSISSSRREGLFHSYGQVIPNREELTHASPIWTTAELEQLQIKPMKVSRAVETNCSAWKRHRVPYALDLYSGKGGTHQVSLSFECTPQMVCR